LASAPEASVIRGCIMARITNAPFLWRFIGAFTSPTSPNDHR
jgi:hypothetical protein